MDADVARRGALSGGRSAYPARQGITEVVRVAAATESGPVGGLVAASYQAAIMRYCEEQGIGYVLRAKRSAELKTWILERPETVWQPLVRDGEAVDGQATCRGVHVITGYDKAFTLVVQRTRKAGQQCLDWGEEDVDTAVTDGGYIYRALATHREALSDSEGITSVARTRRIASRS